VSLNLDNLKKHIKLSATFAVLSWDQSITAVRKKLRSKFLLAKRIKVFAIDGACSAHDSFKKCQQTSGPKIWRGDTTKKIRLIWQVIFKWITSTENVRLQTELSCISIVKRDMSFYKLLRSIHISFCEFYNQWLTKKTLEHTLVKYSVKKR
jgi:hypothetical protein